MQTVSTQCAGSVQRGAVAIMFAASLVVVAGVFGLALDVSRLYNRKAELQNMADAAALAGARELNGTAAGVISAAAKAKITAEALRYQYDNLAFTWSDDAIQFAETPDAGSWTGLGVATATPKPWRYVKVDTSALSTAYGVVAMSFMQVAAPAIKQAFVKTRAIAGRSGTNVFPLALCAMSSNAAESRKNTGPPAVDELVEYGFRRGVSYDLMQLNPGGTAPENFLVDPFAVPGTGALVTHTSHGIIGPFVCTGSVALGRVVGASVVVVRDFPIEALTTQINSRFDVFDLFPSSINYCSPDIAPPDKNIKRYVYNTSVPWMTTLREGQSARSVIDSGRLLTVADLEAPASATNTAPMYGPLWSFAHAVPFSAYQAGVPEPVGGYPQFSATDWAGLYKPGQPVPNGYPGSSTPYAASGNDTFQPPNTLRKGVRNRRVLNVPLLECPIAATTPAVAKVRAIGRFFMTVPVKDKQLHAEFGGLVSEQAIGGNVELYQ